MNTIVETTTHYLRPSRTIERLIIESGKKLHECFIYNYEGYYFRFFECRIALDSFFNFGQEPLHSFETESELDDFLERYQFYEWTNLKLLF